ncbi:hypothetical protein ACFPYJ_29415 [Paenibacillus solisilvae]|uniref:Uncharacterized protein n=1 Tax=Paenibacillus solisilvae TaxID=2486751 RepID=A0ABW0W823_9BACL
MVRESAADVDAAGSIRGHCHVFGSRSSPCHTSRRSRFTLYLPWKKAAEGIYP